MPDKKISQMDPDTSLDGSEVVPVVQSGNKRTTTGAIAGLAPGTNLTYDPATRLLSSSTGTDVTIPLVNTTAAGLVPHTWLTGAEAATLPDVHGNLTGVVYEHVRNESGAPMPALTPYHVIGSHGDTSTVLIGPADPEVPASMPASGILAEELAPNAEGRGALAGVLTGVDTSAWASGMLLYVAVGGGLTATMPTAGVQAVAVVGRSHATTGTLAMLSGPALARVAYSGDYNHLANKPTLGSAAAQDASAFATAAQGLKADAAVQPGTLATVLGDYALETDFRFSDAREWVAATVDQAEAEAGTATTRRAWTAQRVRQAVAGWWTATSTAAGRLLVTAADAAAQRTALGLGDSATRNVGTAPTDVAAGNAPAAALASHLADADPHPAYLKSTELLAGTNVTLDKTTTPGSVIINSTGGGAGGSPGGSSGQAQFNNSGAFGGAAGLTIDPTTGRLTLASFLAAPSAPVTPASAGFVLYAAPTTGALSWKGGNGFVSTLNTTGNTGDRAHQLQDKSGTLAHLDDVFDGYAVGNYIMPVNTALASGNSSIANTIFLQSFIVARSIRIDELACRVGTASPSSLFQLAIYNSSNRLPGTVLIATTDMSGATATALSSSIAETTLRAGRLYWFASNTTSSIAFVCVAGTTSYTNYVIGAESLSVVSSGPTVSQWNRSFAQTYGQWPDLTGQTTVLSAGTRCPIPVFRVSALL